LQTATSREKVELPPKTVDHSTPDLECLDDKYFLSEIDKLMYNAQYAQRKKLFNSKGSKEFDTYGNNYVTSLLKRLGSLKLLMNTSYSKFNPNSVLEELNHIDYCLKYIWQGRVDILPPLVERTTNPKRYGADDVADDDDDDDDDGEY